MTNGNSASIVSKVWNCAHDLKNAGVGYGDYVEQITYVLFLKLTDEMTTSRQMQEYERDELRRSRYARLPSVRNRGLYCGRAFWGTTANKQLNFLQHIVNELKVGGTAAVVLPDKVLFEGRAGDCRRRRKTPSFRRSHLVKPEARRQTIRRQHLKRSIGVTL